MLIRFKPQKNLRERREQNFAVRLGLLSAEELQIYKFWLQYFGKKIALWAAEEGVFPPRKGEEEDNVSKLLLKRVTRLKYKKDDYPKATRAELIQMLDRDIAYHVALTREYMGKCIDEDSIFYELTT